MFDGWFVLKQFRVDGSGDYGKVAPFSSLHSQEEAHQAGFKSVLL